MKNIKNTLLSLDLVIDNEYLDKYVELIESNLTTKRQKYKTERHHIIPRVYYKHIKDKSYSSWNNKHEVNTENVVNLLYKDHILAHYYLVNCAKEEWFKESMSMAFLMMTFYTKLSEDDIIKFKVLEKYQEIYEKSKQYFSNASRGKKHGRMSLESRQRLSKALKDKPKSLEHKQALKMARDFHASTKNRKSIYNKTLDKVKFVFEEELESYLINGWQLGGKPLTIEAKQKIGKSNSLALKGKKHVKEKKEGCIFSGLVGQQVVCVETKQIFENVDKARQWLKDTLGIEGGHIKNCCKNIQSTCGRYHWRYLKDYEE